MSWEERRAIPGSLVISSTEWRVQGGLERASRRRYPLLRKMLGSGPEHDKGMVSWFAKRSSLRLLKGRLSNPYAPGFGSCGICREIPHGRLSSFWRGVGNSTYLIVHLEEFFSFF